MGSATIQKTNSAATERGATRASASASQNRNAAHNAACATPSALTGEMRDAISSMNAVAIPNQSAASAVFARTRRGVSDLNSSIEKTCGPPSAASASAKPATNCAARLESASQNAGSID